MTQQRHSCLDVPGHRDRGPSTSRSASPRYETCRNSSAPVGERNTAACGVWGEERGPHVVGYVPNTAALTTSATDSLQSDCRESLQPPALSQPHMESWLQHFRQHQDTYTSPATAAVTAYSTASLSALMTRPGSGEPNTAVPATSTLAPASAAAEAVAGLMPPSTWWQAHRGGIEGGWGVRREGGRQEGGGR